MGFLLTITRPDGRPLTRNCEALYQARREAAWELAHPAYEVGRAAAMTFAASLMPDGTDRTHEETGLVFRITPTDKPTEE